MNYIYETMGFAYTFKTTHMLRYFYVLIQLTENYPIFSYPFQDWKKLQNNPLEKRQWFKYQTTQSTAKARFQYAACFGFSEVQFWNYIFLMSDEWFAVDFIIICLLTAFSSYEKRIF